MIDYLLERGRKTAVGTTISRSPGAREIPEHLRCNPYGMALSGTGAPGGPFHALLEPACPQSAI